MIRCVGIPSRFHCFGARPRTEIFELLNLETRGKRWGDWRLIFIAERSGLLPRLERHCRRAEIRTMVTAAGTMPIFVVKSAR
jgi:hypothetical protein